LDSFELISPEDINLNIDIEENGNTFEDNAILKAEAYPLAFNGLAISSDGGVTIPVLGDDWNELFTHRFAGNDASDVDRVDSMLKIMESFEDEDRSVLWNESVAVAYKGKALFSFFQNGEKGYLQKEYNKDLMFPGFWLASLWFCPSFGKTYSEITEEERCSQDFTWSKN